MSDSDSEIDMNTPPDIINAATNATNNLLPQKSRAKYAAMSYAVVRGNPNAAQLYLDTVIDAVLEKGDNFQRERDSVTLSEILFHSLRDRLDDVFMINATTGEKFKNEQILKRSVSIARALISAGASGKVVVLMVRNHEQMAAIYLAVIFARVIPLLLEPASTEYEIKQFLKIVTPHTIFCNEDRKEVVTKVLQDTPEANVSVIVANDMKSINDFIGDSSPNIDDFRLADVTSDSEVMMLPTSGSTGPPKAAIMTHKGLVVQLPCIWTSFNTFPIPTKLAFLISTPQWMTHTIVMTSCIAYRVPMVMTPTKTSPRHLLEVMSKYKPTWSLCPPPLASALAAIADANEMTSLETLIVTGSALSSEVKDKIQSKLSPDAYICNGYGMTEMQSFISLPNRMSPLNSSGKIFNTIEYKLVDDDDNQIHELYKTGELYLKSKYGLFKGYYNNKEAFLNTLSSDGWLKSGDWFYEAENEEMFFVARKKFLIKYLNHQISPEEVESVINAIPGVQESVVCGSEKGAAAAVIRRPGAAVTHEQIHEAVSVLSEFKRLRGGVAFVDSFPRTHSGKLLRNACGEMVKDLVNKGLCL